MKEMPFWLASGPDMTAAAAGIGAARAAGRREKRQMKVEAFMVIMNILRRKESRLTEEL